MSVLPACEYVHLGHAWCPWRTSNSLRGLMDDCELQCGLLKMNAGPLQDQPVLLTSELYSRPMLAIFMPT